MPFTPLHMGPGLLMKSIGGRHFSLTVFGFAQVVTDIETAANMARGTWPIHTHLHGYLGAIATIVISLAVGRPFCQWLLRTWNARAGDLRLQVDARISWTGAASGAVLGAWSHVLFDSIMHSDMQPLAPFAATNPQLGWISIPQLHMACLTAAGLGLAILAMRHWLSPRGGTA